MNVRIKDRGGGGDRTLKSEIAGASVFHQKLNQRLMLLLDERSEIRQLLCGRKALGKKKIIKKKVKKSYICRSWSRLGRTAPAEAELRERTRRLERKTGSKRALRSCGGEEEKRRV